MRDHVLRDHDIVSELVSETSTLNEAAHWWVNEAEDQYRSSYRRSIPLLLCVHAHELISGRGVGQSVLHRLLEELGVHGLHALVSCSLRRIRLRDLKTIELGASDPEVHGVHGTGWRGHMLGQRHGGYRMGVVQQVSFLCQGSRAFPELFTPLQRD